ncbi:4647_t:CDS:1, partial [Dentiscutata erythropus]
LSSDNDTSNLSCDSKTASLERGEQILAESDFLETEISKLEQDDSAKNDNPSCNQAQSIISSEINIMTEHQLCDPGSHPHVTETKNDSIQKDS